MKRNYIIPSTQSVAFNAGYICQAASPATGSGVNVTGPGITGGGGTDIVGEPD